MSLQSEGENGYVYLNEYTSNHHTTIYDLKFYATCLSLSAE